MSWQCCLAEGLFTFLFRRRTLTDHVTWGGSRARCSTTLTRVTRRAHRAIKHEVRDGRPWTKIKALTAFHECLFQSHDRMDAWQRQAGSPPVFLPPYERHGISLKCRIPSSTKLHDTNVSICEIESRMLSVLQRSCTSTHVGSPRIARMHMVRRRALVSHRHKGHSGYTKNIVVIQEYSLSAAGKKYRRLLLSTPNDS